MLQNKYLLFLILIINCTFSQQKVDTVYVYEEVIVHDTIYVEKPISNLKFDNVIFTKDEFNKGKLEITQNGKKIEIKVDSTNIVFPKSKTRTKSWFFGGRFHFGIASNSLFRAFGSPNNLGIGIGIWTQKQLFESRFYLGIGIDGFYWNNSFSVDAALDSNALNGYYFSESKQVFLFKSLESNNFMVQIPFQIYYKIKKFKPSIGVFASISNYKSAFLASSGKLPLSLDETKVFEAQALQMGYIAELQYQISKHFSVGLNFSSGKSKNLVFINNNDANQKFKSNTAFSEERFLLQMIYNL